MVRVLKAPEVRKQEILDTAMKLFHKKGYDATSIADIAKEMQVVPGLCYRYFASKQEIFDAAIKQYAKESCQEFLTVIQEENKPFKDRIDAFMMIMSTKEENSRHHDFFHTAGNETFHIQLGMEMFKYLSPYISEEIKKANQRGEITIDDPDLVTQFILHGQTILWIPPLDNSDDQVFQEHLQKIRGYIYRILNINE